MPILYWYLFWAATVTQGNVECVDEDYVKIIIIVKLTKKQREGCSSFKPYIIKAFTLSAARGFDGEADTANLPALTGLYQAEQIGTTMSIAAVHPQIVDAP